MVQENCKSLHGISHAVSLLDGTDLYGRNFSFHWYQNTIHDTYSDAYLGGEQQGRALAFVTEARMH